MGAGAALSHWLPVVGYMGLIFYESSQPALPAAFDHVWDKLLHLGGYAPLAWLTVRALTDRFRQPTTRGRALLAWAITTAYGATDEWHQSFVPLRAMDAGDLLADALGAALVSIGCVYWSRSRPPRR